MRDYGSVSPKFWTGGTGKALRGDPAAQLVALYLMTSPHANMIGVYYCPVDYIAKETGLSVEGATKALTRLSSLDFCTYDEKDEWVFVHQFAAHQVGESLKAEDKRVKGIENELAKLPNGQCAEAFRVRYAEAYHLPESPTQAPLKGQRKPLRSQKQEQEQEQKGEGASPFVLPSWIPKEPWEGYVAMRVKTKKQMTDRARDLVIKELDKLRGEGQDIGKVLDRSTLKNWTDVYAIKGNVVEDADDPYGLKKAVNA